MSSKHSQAMASMRIPETDRFVFAPTGEDVSREGYGSHTVLMACQRLQALSCLYIPEANRLVFVATGDDLAFRMKGNSFDQAGVAM